MRLEAITNMGELMRYREMGIWGGTPGGPRRGAWDAHGSALILNMPEDDVLYISMVYTMLERLRAIIAIQAQEPGADESPDADDEIRELLTGRYGPLFDRGILELRELSRRLALQSLPQWQLLLSDLRSRRTPWRRAGLERAMRALAAHEAESASPSGRLLPIPAARDLL